MATTLITAIQTFAKDHQLNLKPSDISLHISHIQHDDYDALYASIARLLPSIPESLRLPLYEVASHAFTVSHDFQQLRSTCDRFLVRDSSAQHHDATPPGPKSEASDPQPKPQPNELGETADDYGSEYDEVDDYGLDTSSDGPYAIDSIDATLGNIHGESTSRWKLTDEQAFIRPKSGHRTLLYHAGYFPFERQFGVPYFATEAPADSHRYYDDAPSNADVQANAKKHAIDRATLVEAHRPWRRRWSQRESALLKELAANRAGGTRGDDKFADRDECRKIAKAWSPEVWHSLAVQAGKRLSGRPGHALACHYFNAGSEEWNNGDDAFLKDADAVNACLRDKDGGWDVIGAVVKRPGMACLRRWQDIHAQRKSAWSYADDARLRKAVLAVGRQWSAVALIMGDRTGPQCMHRYVKQLTGKRVGRWSLEEIRRLREAVADLGNDWIEIAQRVGTRNDVQCREKWVCGLDPGVKHGSWEANEDELLLKAIRKAGTSAWTQVAEMVPGRTDAQCRRRWALLEQRPVPEKEDLKVRSRARQKAGRWSREELGRLRGAVLELGDKWDEIAKRVGTREEGQCREKWEVLTKTGLADADAATQAGNRAGRWSKEEVRLLNEAYAQIGPKWVEVSNQVGSRDETQCREKWLSLQHAAQELPWTHGDDELLRSLAENEKVDWTQISQKLKRQESTCRRRWEIVGKAVSKKRACDGDESMAKRRKQGRWSLEETRLLNEGLLKHDRDFEAIAGLVKTRNEIQCREKWQSMMNAAAIDATWTDAEDDALTRAIEQNGLAWETIAGTLSGRSVPQCRRRWKVLKSMGRSGRLGRWKTDEIARLRVAVEEFGDDWVKIAERVGSRNDWQCRERVGDGWKEVDDVKLREVVGAVGEKWREVRKLMPGFSEVMCRRRWKELQGKKSDVKVEDSVSQQDGTTKKMGRPEGQG